MPLEKSKLHFTIEKIQQWDSDRGTTIQDEAGNNYYGRKYLINTHPFTFRSKEYSQLVIYFGLRYLEFESISSLNLPRSEEDLKRYLWKLWWWEEENNIQVKTDETEKKIIFSDSIPLTKVEKFRFTIDSLTVNTLENGINWNESKGRLEIKIKPVKISETIKINQLDIAFWRFFNDEVNQKILANFSPKKLSTIYFSERINEENSTTAPEIEIENGQTKLQISLFNLKNEFSDYSWLSSVDNPNYSPNEKAPYPIQKEKWIEKLLPMILLLTVIVFFIIIAYNFTKKKKSELFLNNYYGRSFSFSKC